MRFDPDLSIYKDGCFPDAPLILTEEEYFDKVLFDKALVQTTRFFHWVINNRQGYIQKGEITKNLEWALVYERIKDSEGNDTSIAFNFGDLIIYIPLDERLKWRQFYQDTDIKIDYGDKVLLLFFDKNNDQESGLVRKYWAKRIENLEETEGLPWWTKRQREQTVQELHDLKQIDEKTGQWKDLMGTEFRPQVLDKYRNNDLCKIGHDHISFLGHGRTTVSIAWFNIIDNVLKMFAKDFIEIPRIERSHWYHYQIKKEASNQ
jgi:hypothetical protein